MAQEVPETKSKEDFQASIKTFVHKHRLNEFFDNRDDDLLETIVSKALDLQNDSSSVLGQSQNTDDLVTFALYQPIIYCGMPFLALLMALFSYYYKLTSTIDDSESMKVEDRMIHQWDLVKRIAKICTSIVPDKLGIHLRFINKHLAVANDLHMDDVENYIAKIQPSGGTKIGTNLRTQILDPFVYKRDMRKDRPLLVSIITDGLPQPEHRDTLKNEIIGCQRYLQENSLPPRGNYLTSRLLVSNISDIPEAVVFQVSLIGSDQRSKEFLDGLMYDPQLTNLYVSARKSQMSALRRLLKLIRWHRATRRKVQGAPRK